MTLDKIFREPLYKVACSIHNGPFKLLSELLYVPKKMNYKELDLYSRFSRISI